MKQIPIITWWIILKQLLPPITSQSNPPMISLNLLQNNILNAIKGVHRNVHLKLIIIQGIKHSLDVIGWKLFVLVEDAHLQFVLGQVGGVE